jgi:hypothetical protein
MARAAFSSPCKVAGKHIVGLRINDLELAHAAFAVARTKWPDKHIALCQKAQILRRSW